MFKRSYTYDDIGLVPNWPSVVTSRTQVNTSYNLWGRELSIPVIVAPMKAVVNDQFTERATELGLFTIQPRLIDPENDKTELEYSAKRWLTNNSHEKNLCGLAISGKVNVDDLFRTLKSNTWFHGQMILCIDVANGFSEEIFLLIEKIKKNKSDVKIIAGNVASLEGYRYLHNAGADAVRLGIGNGKACSTSIATGIRRGQASLIREIATWKYEKLREGISPPLIIADGGLKSVGDICKAIALGADLVMTGSMFAGTEESSGQFIVDDEGNPIFKQYYGEASSQGKLKNTSSYIEGEVGKVPFTGKLHSQVNKIKEGLQSCMSYMNSSQLGSFRYLPDYCFTINSLASQMEGLPFGRN